jgi:hypothetical protein
MEQCIDSIEPGQRQRQIRNGDSLFAFLGTSVSLLVHFNWCFWSFSQRSPDPIHVHAYLCRSMGNRHPKIMHWMSKEIVQEMWRDCRSISVRSRKWALLHESHLNLREINILRDNNILCVTMRASKAWHIFAISIARWIEEASAAAYTLTLDRKSRSCPIRDTLDRLPFNCLRFSKVRHAHCHSFPGNHEGQASATKSTPGWPLRWMAACLSGLSSGQEVGTIWMGIRWWRRAETFDNEDRRSIHEPVSSHGKLQNSEYRIRFIIASAL